MKLQSITIENYRSIEKETLEIEEIEGDYTYSLIGINESGKSSFLEAVSLKEGLESVSLHDFHEESKPITVSFKYLITDNDRQSLKEKLSGKGVAEELQEEFTIRELCLKTLVDPTEPTGTKKNLELILNKDVIHDYTITENVISKKEDKSQESLNIRSYLEENCIDFFFELSHTVIFWKSEARFLITDPINLDSFIQDQNTSIPLRNCFTLAGINDIPTEIGKARNNPADINNLQEKLGDKVTEHIKKIWPDHPVRIRFQMDNTSLTFLIEDEGIKYETKTTAQRSDGFRQFVSFLLTISAQSMTGQLSNTVLLIDEPETYLHPKGQENLRDELIKITKGDKNNICIFATHSNYMIDKNRLDRCYMLIKEGNKRTKLNRIDGTKTTYSEVNYVVFDIPTTDYHNELYGYLQDRENLFSEKEFEDYLRSKSIKKDKPYIKLSKDGKTQNYKVTLSTFIRNLIHHPENTKNKYFTRDELIQSIKLLRRLKNES